MKKYILCLTIISYYIAVAQANDWVKSFGDMDGDVVVSGVVTDSENNVIITGTFSSKQLELNETVTLQNNGTYDVFLIKYNPFGDIIWALSMGGDQPDYVNGIASDSESNIYITGNFTSSNLKVGTTTINSIWPDNVYVAKFDKNGVCKWLSHSTGVTRVARGNAVYCDKNQNIFLAGYTNSSEMAFGDITLSLNTFNNKAFYCRLDDQGNFNMARFLGGEGEDRFQLNDITSDLDGNIYLAGKKNIRIEPDPITFQEYRDIMYFCKADSDGEITWAVEDTAFYWAENIILNHDSLFVLGNREEYRFIFNGGTIDTTSSFYFGLFDINANKLWDKTVIGALAYDAYSKNNTILIIGGLLLDNLKLEEFQIQRNSDSSSICPIYQDIFYIESDKSGDIKTVKSIPGSLEDIPTGIWLSNSGDLLYTGKFESAKLLIGQNEVMNFSKLDSFIHVSGKYYDRRAFSFLARQAAFTGPSGVNIPAWDQLLVYPNPSPGLIYLDLSPYTGNVLIKVHDLKGNVLYEKVTNDKLTTIDLSGYSQAMYVVTLIEGNRVVKKPVLIIK